MKKLIVALMAVVLVCSGGYAQKKRSGKSKGKASTSLAVTKGNTSEYGNGCLSTQMFSLKKGKENKLEIEYPTGGNPELVKAVRNYIKDCLDNKFMGSLDTPDALMKKVMKDKKDIAPGRGGESLSEEIKVAYANNNIVTFEDEGYMYMGGAHGASWTGGETFLVADGQVFDESMLPSFSVMKPYILSGLAQYFGVSAKDLGEELMGSVDSLDYPGVFYIKDNGLNFVYQQYEIAPYSAGIPTAVVPITQEVINLFPASAKPFFQGF